MAGFADVFNPDSIGKLMQDPRMLLGLQLMAQSRQGSGAQALGQAGSQAAQMLGEQRRAQELAQYRQQMSALQQQQLAMRQQAAEAEAEQTAQYRAQLQDPGFLSQLGPMSRTMAQLGVDPAVLVRAGAADNLEQHREAQLRQQAAQFDQRQSRVGGAPSGPKMRAQPLLIPEHLPGGMIQDHRFNPDSGEYEKWGQPYSRYSPGRQKTNAAVDAMADEIVGGAPTANLSQLPGTGSLASYAPRAHTQIPMVAGGSLKNATPTVASAQGPAAPKTRADYDALPSGAKYIDPASGRVATKR
jgi:hypothetical protein